MISTKLLPFVSGIIVMTKMTPASENPENKNMLPCIPMATDNIGKYLSIKKANTHNTLKQIDEPPSFICAINEKKISGRRYKLTCSLTFSGKISDITKNGRVNMPQFAKNMTNEKQEIGTHPSESTLKSMDFRYR